MSRKLWIALALAVGMLVFGATTAVAHRASFNTDIVVTNAERTAPNTIRIAGRLDSPLGPCERNRVVYLHAAEDNSTPNDRSDDTFTFVDKDTTDLQGRFVLEGNYPAGTDYFVIHVRRKVIQRSGHRHVCQADVQFVEEPPPPS